MSGLFLMSVLLLPHATFNCKCCKVWDASLFTSVSFPTYSCPQMVCIKLLSVSPCTLKVAGPWGWTHSKLAMPPKHSGLGFVYLCIYLYPMWQICISGHNSRVQKKSHFFLFLQIELKGCCASTCWVGRKFSSCFENPSLSPSWGLKQPPGSYQVQNWGRVL